MEKIIIRPSETSDYLVYGLLCLTWGLLIGFSWAHNEFYLPNRKELAVVEATNEILVAHSDYQACWALAANQRTLGIKGFEILTEWAAVAREQLPEDMAYRCMQNGPLWGGD